MTDVNNFITVGISEINNVVYFIIFKIL